MADPDRVLRRLRKRIDELQSRQGLSGLWRPALAHGGMGGWDDQLDSSFDDTELARLQDEYDRLRRRNPRAGRHRIEELPADIRHDLPGHWRDWYVLDTDAARHLRADDCTRFYHRTRKGWARCNSLAGAHIGEPVWPLRRFQPASAPRHTGHHQSELVPEPRLGPKPQTYSPGPVVTGPDKRRLEIEMANDNDVATSFGVSGSGYRVSRNAMSEGDIALFGDLNEDHRYTLTASRGGRFTIFRDLPFSDLDRPGKLTRDALEPQDPKSPAHLLAHDGSGTVPRLRFSTEPPQFAVFFDGTAKNMHNELQTNPDTVSNIGKLYQLYDDDRVRDLFGARYINGLGTRDGEPDPNLSDYMGQGFGFGAGQRIQDALEESVDFFKDFDYATVGVIDVFGFSRGASLARVFVNAVHHLSQTQPDYWGGLRIHVRFVGLYDTVGSFGWPGTRRNSFGPVWSNYDGPVALGLAPEAAERVYHLTAEDEIRKNFPLTPLQPESGQPLPGHFIEESMPGVHADIGGGYAPGEESVVLGSERLSYTSADLETINADRARFMAGDERAEAMAARYADRVRPGMQVRLAISDRPRRSERRGVAFEEWVRVLGEREHVKQELSHVSLKRLYDQAVAAGVPLLPIDKLDIPGLAWKIPNELAHLMSKVERDGRDSEAFEALYQHYIHHSHKYGNLADAPEKDGRRKTYHADLLPLQETRMAGAN